FYEVKTLYFTTKPSYLTMKLSPLPSKQVLDLYYLDARCQLLEVAALLDRVDRGDASAVADDGRLQRLRAAIDVLNSPQDQPNRAEQLLNLFS
ncbi:MAG: hypothetical protein IKW80_01045, partial [Thermoguttaceae bacterium]|nr:hypothetical protein [Thermoguttaceae bacterium]